MNQLPETISYKEASERWGVDRAVIQREIGKGNIKAYLPGKRMQICVESGDAWFLGSDERAMKSASGLLGKRR